MKFKHLGRFGVLAVCLFAIVIVMGGCGGDEDDPPPDKPVEIVTPPVELTPMEKLAGTYWYAEENVDSELLDFGKLNLGHGGTGWSLTYEWRDDGTPTTLNSGPSWSASAATITYVYSDGRSDSQDYTLVGKTLTLTYRDSTIRKWRKMD